MRSKYIGLTFIIEHTIHLKYSVLIDLYHPPLSTNYPLNTFFLLLPFLNYLMIGQILISFFTLFFRCNYMECHFSKSIDISVF